MRITIEDGGEVKTFEGEGIFVSVYEGSTGINSYAVIEKLRLTEATAFALGTMKFLGDLSNSILGVEPE